MDAEIVSALVKVVELKDQSTAAHTWRVALYAQALAEAFDLEPEHVRRVMRAAVLHDIGKIDIPYEILAKPSRLTDEEFEIIKTHTTLGHERLLRMGETDELILSLVRSHHERLDGSGYPDGLRGDDIPRPARYFAVIDSFDAMTSLRPYRRVTGSAAAERAMDELRSKSGLWYCPESVEMFTALHERGMLKWISEHFNDEESLEELNSGPDPEQIDETRERILAAESSGNGAASGAPRPEGHG
ncbi:MAG: HD-GYP domain-containing protein [Planctomycetota bacterium]|jgi:putative nucleotidyltransferase with HDIG domain